MDKLNAKELRTSNPTEDDLRRIKRNPIYFILDRIIDTYNTGSLFRLADAVGAEKMYLCGEMEYPPNSRIHKAAMGTEKWVPWEKVGSTLEVIKRLRNESVQTIAIEQDSRATSYQLLDAKFPVAIVVGNESVGIKKRVLDEVDTIIELPMYGINTSFNTWGCTAVVSYKLLENLQ